MAINFNVDRRGFWSDTPRDEKLRLLKSYFLQCLVEDSRDGTPFDCDVLDAIEKLETKYNETLYQGEV